MLKQLLEPEFRYFLSSVDYTPTPQFAGPPCALPQHEVQQLFGEYKLTEFICCSMLIVCWIF